MSLQYIYKNDKHVSCTVTCPPMSASQFQEHDTVPFIPGEWKKPELYLYYRCLICGHLRWVNYNYHVLTTSKKPLKNFSYASIVILVQHLTFMNRPKWAKRYLSGKQYKIVHHDFSLFHDAKQYNNTVLAINIMLFLSNVWSKVFPVRVYKQGFCKKCV